MNNLLSYSIFQRVLFPERKKKSDAEAVLTLRRQIRFNVRNTHKIFHDPLVVFDLETTGLDSLRDRIIEIGAIRIENGEVVGEFSSLVSTDAHLSETITKLTGITKDMLVGKPTMREILPQFLKFIDGAVLSAHNAPFDVGFVKAECDRQGIDLEWPAFCTLKMCRELLPELERKDLGSLAQHFGFTFEARHRSIGDVKVTIGVLQNLLQDKGKHLQSWQDMAPFVA